MGKRSWNNVLIGGERAYVSQAEAEALLDARDTLLRDMADVLRQVEGAGQGLCMCEHLPKSERTCFDCRLADVLRRAGEVTP